jgi:hypothetical protein
MLGAITQCLGTNQEALRWHPRFQHDEYVPTLAICHATMQVRPVRLPVYRTAASLICGPWADQAQEWYMCEIFLVGAIVPCSGRMTSRLTRDEGKPTTRRTRKALDPCDRDCGRPNDGLVTTGPRPGPAGMSSCGPRSPLSTRATTASPPASQQTESPGSPGRFRKVAEGFHGP